MGAGRELLGGIIKLGGEVLSLQRHGGAQTQAGCVGKVGRGKQQQAVKVTRGPVVVVTG